MWVVSNQDLQRDRLHESAADVGEDIAEGLSVR